MSRNPHTISPLADSEAPAAEFGAYRSIVDYILGITFEIWEQRQVDRILDYYGRDIDVFSLEGITRGASDMVAQTHATLEAFPDRLLLGDDVIWSGKLERGFSSHRITSPMTNLGKTIFGPATGRPVRTMNIADCEITGGRITREWLLRDNLSLVTQLGMDPSDCAAVLADRFDGRFREWLEREHGRVSNNIALSDPTIGEETTDGFLDFARSALELGWITGEAGELESVYAPYCVLQRAPFRLYSGRREIFEHQASLRNAFPDARLVVDHVCSQPYNRNSRHVAVRWSIAASHEGVFAGQKPTGKPVYVVGATHWRVLDGRIVAEWTVFDELSLLAQILDTKG